MANVDIFSKMTYQYVIKSVKPSCAPVKNKTEMNTINIVKLPIEQLHIDKRTFVTINNDSRSLKKIGN